MIAFIAAYLAVGVLLFPLLRADRWPGQVAIWAMRREMRRAAPEVRHVWRAAIRQAQACVDPMDLSPDPALWVLGWPVFFGAVIVVTARGLGGGR